MKDTAYNCPECGGGWWVIDGEILVDDRDELNEDYVPMCSDCFKAGMQYLTGMKL